MHTLFILKRITTIFSWRIHLFFRYNFLYLLYRRKWEKIIKNHFNYFLFISKIVANLKDDDSVADKLNNIEFY
jgi:hypothetical protein